MNPPNSGPESGILWTRYAQRQASPDELNALIRTELANKDDEIRRLRAQSARRDIVAQLTSAEINPVGSYAPDVACTPQPPSQQVAAPPQSDLALVQIAIDGDATLFSYRLIQRGYIGGHQAQVYPSLLDPLISATVFVDLEKLVARCQQDGIPQHEVFGFVKGFNEARPQFSMLNVGNDPAASRRLTKALQSLSLNEVSPLTPGTATTVTSQGTPASWQTELTQALISPHALDPTAMSPIKPQLRTLAQSSQLSGVSAASGTPRTWDGFHVAGSAGRVASGAPSRNSTNNDSRLCRPAASAYIPGLQPLPSPPRTAGTPRPVKAETSRQGGSIWFLLNSTKPPEVQRNRSGQRVDNVDFTNLPKPQIDSLKQLKLCNAFYLLGGCNNPRCHHVHTKNITDEELYCLYLIARMTPCRNGPTCSEPRCIYGHRCPYSPPGTVDCKWRNECRFPKSAHGVELEVVQRTQV
ncbi:hypothetical protein KEM52_004369 [Ascosphaera acerosa]|nr:hypothetical protein KEM52_004369 [Ascosphaera acerosa]